MTNTFVYTARSREGRALSGTLCADSSEQALAHLRSRSVCVTSLEALKSPRGMLLSVTRFRRVDRQALVAFFRSFAAMISAGVPLRRAIAVSIERCPNERLREALESISSDIETGSALSAAMERRGSEFPRLLVMMLRAAEVGGILDLVLERIAQLLERDRALRARVAAALTYPGIVAGASLGLILFLLANTMPSFAAMFAQLHVQLPASTLAFIAVGKSLQSPRAWLLIALGCGMLLTAISAIHANPAIREPIDRWLLRIPIIGNILAKSSVARFARTLGTMLGAGVGLEQALDAARDVIGNRVYVRHVDSIARTLREGRSVTAAMDEQEIFDPIVLQLVRVGEETGTLDAMLVRLAEYYEVEVEAAVASLGSALEPILIIVLGAVVGAIVSSILIPLYSVIGSIK